MSEVMQVDVYTKKPRRPYLPYSILTDEQIKNIQKVLATFHDIKITLLVSHLTRFT